MNLRILGGSSIISDDCGNEGEEGRDGEVLEELHIEWQVKWGLENKNNELRSVGRGREGEGIVNGERRVSEGNEEGTDGGSWRCF